MAVTATLVRNRDGFRFALWSGDRGWEGERNYYVNTDLEDSALLAAGLPQYGDSWGTGELAECRVYKVGPAERLGGKDTTGEGAGGHCRVPVFYRSPQGASFSVPTLTRAWTELRSVSGTVTAKYPIGTDQARLRLASAVRDPDGGPTLQITPPYAKIGNGDGASVFVGGVEARVHRWVPFDAAYDYARLIGLTRPAKLNAEPIVLPRINDQPQSFSVAAGQALYTSFEVARAGVFQEIIHTLQLAEHWRVIWQPENEKGEGLQLYYFDEVYESASFSGLWPI